MEFIESLAPVMTSKLVLSIVECFYIVFECLNFLGSNPAFFPYIDFMDIFKGF